MKAFYMHTQKFNDKFEVVCRDAHVNAGGSYQTTESRLVIKDGQLENVVISHDDVPQLVLHFFDSEQGRMVAYKALGNKQDLLTADWTVAPGVYSVYEYLEKFGSFFRVSHIYKDGGEWSRFYFYPRNNTIVFSNKYTGREIDGYKQADAIFKLDAEQGLVRDANLALRGENEVLPIRELKSLDDIEPKRPVSKEELLKRDVEVQKLAILSELTKLTLTQQQDVLAAAKAKLDLYRSNYGKE